MSEPRPLHRLFELSWIDFFEGTEVEVEPEMDLSLKKQLIDLVIIRGDSHSFPRPLPDGFEVLAPHNLVTFKSHQEAFDGWALCELIGHYVNYRKQSSPSMRDLLPDGDFQMFAVSARFPRDLAQQAELTRIREGVYDLRVGAKLIRIVVVGELVQAQHNAMLHLFSAREELLRYGREHYRPHSDETSGLLYELFHLYSEDPNMTQKQKDYIRESLAELMKRVPAEERLKGLSPEERLKGLPAEERLKGLSVEEVLRGLDPETLETLKRQVKENGNGSKPQ